MAKARNLVFAVNGERFELSSIDPCTTLLEFLRTRTRYKGAKLGCGEGGCGACVVLLSKYDPVSRTVEDFTLCSCLTLLCSIHFCSITTTEGLGNIKDGFHSIHQRIAGFHASQCGFCTPGVCMSIFSALKNADKTSRPEPPPGFSKLTVSEAEKVAAGHLCRCTGYRSIVDTCKSFASNVDLEDLGLNSFWRRGEINVDVGRLPLPKNDSICTFPEFLKSEIETSLDSSCSLTFLQHSDLDTLDRTNCSRAGCYYLTRSLDELIRILYSEANRSRIKLVAGNTSAGVFKEIDNYDLYIDIRHIPELSEIRIDNTCVEIGAAVTISQAIEVLIKQKDGCSSIIFTKIANHLNKLASQFVRNTSTIGGNIVMAQKNKFPSDVATILLGANSSVCIHMGSERLVISIEEFLKNSSFYHNFLLLSICIPSWNSVNNEASVTNNFTSSHPSNESRLFFETYRAAPRPLGNAIAYVNAAFLAQISSHETSGKFIIDNVHLAFGAYSSGHAIRARNVEQFLNGKTVNVAIMMDAIQLLKEIIILDDDIDHCQYKISVAVAFLFEFLQQFSEESIYSVKNPLMVDASSVKLQRRHVSVANKATNDVVIDEFGHDVTLLTSRQVVQLNGEYCPIGEPVNKTGVELQASGIFLYP